MDTRDATVILITDNAKAVLREIDILEKGGRKVLAVAGGKRAIERVGGSADIGLAVIDLEPGEIQEARRTALAIQEVRPLPIVLLLSGDTPAPVVSARDSGIYGLIPKGSPAFALESAITTALERFEADQRISALTVKYEMLKRAERTAKFGCWELTLAAGRIIGSDGAREIYGVAEDDDLLESIKTVPLPEFRPLLARALKDLIAGEKPYSAVFKIKRRSDGRIVDIHSTAEYDARTGIVFGTIQDITRQTEAEAELQESEGRYSALFRDTASAMLLIDPGSGQIIDVNHAACEFYGWSKEELTARNIAEINTLSPDEIRGEMDLAISKRRSHFNFRHRRADGSVRDVEVYSGPIVVKGKGLLYSIIHDVTEARLAQAENARLIEEKDLLLKEVHHRIKNNMNTISSLLYLQATNIDDQAAKDALTDARSRVVGMMDLYDRLYRANDFRVVSAKDYLGDLVHDIAKMYAAERPICFKLDIGEEPLDTKILVPLGIIVNELIVDALKYAFPDGRGGNICITMGKREKGMIELVVHDDGVGMQSSPATSNGFGLILVNALAAQLGGTLGLLPGEGTTHRLAFKA